MCRLGLLLSYSLAAAPHMHSRSQLKSTSHVLSISYAKAKLITFLFMHSRKAVCICGNTEPTSPRLPSLPPPEQLTQVIRYFLEGRPSTWGLHTSHTSGHDHSATPSPSRAQPRHIWPQRPGTFSFPPVQNAPVVPI